MSADQWFPKAVREPGHPQAHGYAGEQEPGHKAGAVYHSAEGSIATMRSILASYGEPSWTFSNPKVGRLIQAYPVGYHTWANGSLSANVRYVSCESEGVAGDGLTPSQVQNLIDLTCWLKRRFGWTGLARRVELWEHNELAQTACPSGRIPWDKIVAGAREEDDEVTALEEVRQLRKEVEAVNAFQNKLLVGAYDAIKFLSAIAVDVVKRLKELERA